MEAEVQALKAAQGATPYSQVTVTTGAPQSSAPALGTPPQEVQVPTGAPGITSQLLPVYGGAGALAKALNPDISFIGDFLGSVGRNSAQPVPPLGMHESELGLRMVPISNSASRPSARAWTMGTLVSALGVYFSVVRDLPTRATIVCTFGMILAVMFLSHFLACHRIKSGWAGEGLQRSGN